MKSLINYKFSFLIAVCLSSSLLFQAEAAQKRLDDERAILKLKVQLKQNPNDAKALFQMGWYMQKRNFHQQAQEYYLKCLKNEPRYVSAVINLGNIAQRMKKYQRAKGYYLRAIKMQPDSSDAHYNLGTLYIKQKNFFGGINSFERTLALEPRNKSALLNLASIYLVLYKKKPSKHYLKIAKTHLVKASRIDPRYGHVYFNLARVYEYEDKKSVAIQYYKEAIRFYSRNHRFKRKAQERIVYLRSLM